MFDGFTSHGTALIAILSYCKPLPTLCYAIAISLSRYIIYCCDVILCYNHVTLLFLFRPSFQLLERNHFTCCVPSLKCLRCVLLIALVYCASPFLSPHFLTWLENRKEKKRRQKQHASAVFDGELVKMRFVTLDSPFVDEALVVSATFVLALHFYTEAQRMMGSHRLHRDRHTKDLTLKTVIGAFLCVFLEVGDIVNS